MKYLLRVRGPDGAGFSGGEVDASGELVGELVALGSVGQVAQRPAGQTQGLGGSAN